MSNLAQHLALAADTATTSGPPSIGLAVFAGVLTFSGVLGAFLFREDADARAPFGTLLMQALTSACFGGVTIILVYVLIARTS